MLYHNRIGWVVVSIVVRRGRWWRWFGGRRERRRLGLGEVKITVTILGFPARISWEMRATRNFCEKIRPVYRQIHLHRQAGPSA
jgi:hypothetical protein